MRERDLFRAIVLSGAALAATPGCSSDPAPTDAGRDAPVTPEDAPVAIDDAPAATDTGILMADAGSDAGVAADDAGETDAGEDAMVLIL